MSDKQICGEKKRVDEYMERFVEEDTGIVEGDFAVKELYSSAYLEGSFMARLQEEVGAFMNESLSLNNLVTKLKRELEGAHKREAALVSAGDAMYEALLLGPDGKDSVTRQKRRVRLGWKRTLRRAKS